MALKESGRSRNLRFVCLRALTETPGARAERGKVGFDKRGECLHCNDMKRSFPLAQDSVGTVQSSSRQASLHVCSRAISPSPGSRHLVVGFTLIELLIVVAIIAILAGLTIAILGRVNQGSAEAKARGEISAIASALEDFRLEYAQLPEPSRLGFELIGAPGAAINTSRRVFFEPSQANYTNGQFIDPWGNAYVYQTNPVSGFELYSLGSETNDSNSYIRE